MSFLYSFKSYFSNQDHLLVQGEGLFNRAQCEILHSDREDLWIRVKDNGNNYVHLMWDEVDENFDLVGHCSCANFKRHATCQHFAAAMFVSLEDSFSKRVSGDYTFEVIAAQDFYLNEFYYNKFVDDERFRGIEIQDDLYRLKSIVDKDLSVTGTPHLDKGNEILYCFSKATSSKPVLHIEYKQRAYLKNGGLGKIKKLSIPPKDIEFLPNLLDREILSFLTPYDTNSFHYYSMKKAKQSEAYIPEVLKNDILAKISKTGRFIYQVSEKVWINVSWNPMPWRFQLRVHSTEDGFDIEGEVHRGKEVFNICQIESIFTLSKYVLINGELAPLDIWGHENLVKLLLKDKKLSINKEHKAEVIDLVANNVGLEKVSGSENLGIQKENILPKKILELSFEGEGKQTRALLRPLFDYRGDIFPYQSNISITSGEQVSELKSHDGVFYVKNRDLEVDWVEEVEAVDGLIKNSFNYYYLSLNQINEVIKKVIELGWEVVNGGLKVRPFSAGDTSVKTELDWFELKSEIAFGDMIFSMPEVLKKLKKKSMFVTLGSDEVGFVPDKWLNRYKNLLEIGHAEGDAILFKKNYALLLEGLFDEKEAQFDDEYYIIRNQLINFDIKVKKEKPLLGFKGTLREYQQKGLGWLKFLENLKVGGCLADDMGLGKTVQVISCLHDRVVEGEKKPSLIIVPKSLLFNWQREIEKFAPHLKVYEYGGQNRDVDQIKKVNIVLASYGIIRRDIDKLKSLTFDYCILDEAQAIKNSKSLTAQSICLINSEHRLAMTGTPVENSLKDLFSIFKFLQPSLFGRRYFARDFNKEDKIGEYLVKGLRPFILRRTKGEVLKDLPEKMEDTLYCELTGEQEKFYLKLKNYYRTKFDEDNPDKEKDKLLVIEAMLRLRQSACHIGLIDHNLNSIDSAKIDILIDKLHELQGRGAKAVVFSQFTSFLKIVQERLIKEGIKFQYLDGQTKDREYVVNDFKEDNSKCVFLISLKAGGVGLNLTEASYCFLLDPWWNPAIEAQAIDRIHRIGQKNKVTAYRLIAKGTIEEKVLTLQEQKRELSKDLLTSDESFLKGLTKSDIRFLFT